MTEEDLFAVKPGNIRSKITNFDFRKNQIKIHRLDKHGYSQVDSQDGVCKKNQQQAKKPYVCKYRHRDSGVSGFNFKKCNATKFIYGTGTYKYTYSRDYNHSLVDERNIQKKCRQKLRSELCLKWE